MIYTVKIEIEDNEHEAFFNGLNLISPKEENESNEAQISRLTFNAIVGPANDGIRKIVSQQAAANAVMPDVTITTSQEQA